MTLSISSRPARGLLRVYHRFHRRRPTTGPITVEDCEKVTHQFSHVLTVENARLRTARSFVARAGPAVEKSWPIIAALQGRKHREIAHADARRRQPQVLSGHPAGAGRRQVRSWNLKEKMGRRCWNLRSPMWTRHVWCRKWILGVAKHEPRIVDAGGRDLAREERRARCRLRRGRGRAGAGHQEAARRRSRHPRRGRPRHRRVRDLPPLARRARRGRPAAARLRRSCMFEAQGADPRHRGRRLHRGADRVGARSAASARRRPSR